MSTDNPLSKSELTKFLEKRYFLDGSRTKKCYVFVNESVESNYWNPGVPSMLITSISQFVKKCKSNLIVEDAFTMYESIKEDLKENISYSTIKKWRERNKLSFFGMSQYALLNYYLENIAIRN